MAASSISRSCSDHRSGIWSTGRGSRSGKCTRTIRPLVPISSIVVLQVSASGIGNICSIPRTQAIVLQSKCQRVGSALPQLHSVHGPGGAVGFLYVHLGKLHVALKHSDVLVTEEPLELQHVAAVPQEVDSEGVP